MKRSPKPTDLNARAASVVAQATGAGPPVKEKNPHAVALGALGGEARAAQFKTQRERREAASNAAKARWAKWRERQAEAQ